MFLNLWSKSRCEDVPQEKIHIRPSGSPYLPVNHATSSSQDVNWKQDECNPGLPRRDAPSSKLKMETMSTVENPSNDPQRIPLSASFTQAATRTASIPIECFSRTSVGEQAYPLNGCVGPATSLPRDTAPKMDRRDLVEGQGNQQTSRLQSGIGLETLRDAVEFQFNLEILLKHKELQLIDREIAKCQIGLEQLRRCTIIPYPAMTSGHNNLQNVSDGSGPVYHNSAPQAPAWGVTDGPYTRHYARWLIQDPAFDDTVSHEVMSASVAQAAGDRTTRGTRHDRHSIAGKSRSSRGINNTRLSSLPDAHPVTKEEKGPCIVTRSSDKKRVKLVCPSCRRSDFNSAQGFINHCRIGHARAFASHDAAINQCGEEIDDESETANEVVASQGTANAGRVHPLVRLAFSHAGLPSLELPAPAQPSKKRKVSAFDTEPSSSLAESSSPAMGKITIASPAPLSKKSKASTSPIEPPLSSSDEASPPAASKTMKTSSQSQNIPPNIDGKEGPKQPLKLSSETPYLSKLVARLGKGGDLDGMVKQATTKPEIDPEQLSDEEEMVDTETEAVLSEPMVRSRSTQGGMRPSAPSLELAPSIPQQQPHSMDGANDMLRTIEPSKQRARYPSPYGMRLEHTSPHADASTIDVNTPFDLSPNSTDPHPAPSLVSDDGDGDFENMHSDFESPSDVGDERNVHQEPEVMDHDGIDLGESSGLNMGHAKHNPHHDHHGPTPEIVAPTRRSRVASTSARVNGTNNEKQLGSQNSSREQKKASKAKSPR